MGKKHIPYVKADKLGRICEIVWGDDPRQNPLTPKEFKETLNMFRGRQLRTNLRECIAYLKLSLKKQEGNVQVAEEMTNIHKSWNS